MHAMISNVVLRKQFFLNLILKSYFRNLILYSHWLILFAVCYFYPD